MRAEQAELNERLHYKGYFGSVERDPESGDIYGRVLGIRDVVTFSGDTHEECVRQFHVSVDVYLDFCESRGEAPEKPTEAR